MALSPQYKGVAQNRKYRVLEVEIARMTNNIPEWRRNNPDEYFTKRDAARIAQLVARMHSVKFNG